MKVIKSNRYGKIVPVKLIGKQLIKIKDIPCLESKKVKNILDTSISTSTEPSNNRTTTSHREVNKQVEELADNLTKKYHQLMDDVKNEKEMIGTVEENVGEYPNHDPFGPSSNLHTQSYISKAKKVLFKKSPENELVLKILDSDLYLSIYNKAPPQKKFFRRSEVSTIIKVQNRFKGIFYREVEKKVDRLKASDCILETMLLLVGRAYDNAIRKKTLRQFKKEFLDPFNNIDDELEFEDKIQFKLPDRYYNISNIRDLSSARRSPTKKN